MALLDVSRDPAHAPDATGHPSTIAGDPEDASVTRLHHPAAIAARNTPLRDEAGPQQVFVGLRIGLDEPGPEVVFSDEAPHGPRSTKLCRSTADAEVARSPGLAPPLARAVVSRPSSGSGTSSRPQ